MTKTLNPFLIVVNLWKHRNLIQRMIRREVGQRYRGSYLGILWSFLVPIAMMVAYTFVFSVIFKVRWRADAAENTTGSFAMTLFAGLTAFSLFSEVVGRAPGLVLAVPNYVKKVIFPVEILPVVAVGSALVNSLISALLVLTGTLFFVHTVSPTFLFLPLVYVPLVFLCLGLAWFLASFGVYVRDTLHVTGIVVQILFFLSPVFYPVSAVPERARFLFELNPMTSILDSFRRVLLWGQMPDWQTWGLWTVGCGVVCLLGYGWFMATKQGFADVI